MLWLASPSHSIHPIKVKRIIPAIASTNALIAAALVVEALKIATYCGPVLNNYMMYMGQQGTHSGLLKRSSYCIDGDGDAIERLRPWMKHEVGP